MSGSMIFDTALEHPGRAFAYPLLLRPALLLIHLAFGLS